MNKAQIERLTQLALAAQGKSTKRPLNEILAGEKLAAQQFIARAPAVTTVTPLPTEVESQA